MQCAHMCELQTEASHSVTRKVVWAGAVCEYSVLCTVQMIVADLSPATNNGECRSDTNTT